MKRMVFPASLMALITAIVFTISCKGPGGNKSVLLKFNLQAGKNYEYQLSWRTDQEISGQASSITINATYQMNVINDDNAIKTLKVTYASFDMLMNVMGMEIKASTADPKPVISSIEKENDIEGIMSRLFGHIGGKSFTMKVDAGGEVVAISGFREIVTGMVDSVNVADYIKQQMVVSLADQFNEQETKDAFTRVMTIYPNKDVKAGDSWTKSYASGGRTPAKHDITYTLKEIRDNQAVIHINSTLSTITDLSIKGSEKGEMFVEIPSGLVTNGAINQEMQAVSPDMTVNIKANGTVRGKSN